jgi:S1-C subfamily serine protease
MKLVQRGLAVFLLLQPGVAPGDGNTDREVLALQKAVENAIARAEPGIACVLVSRSERYAVLGQGPDSDIPGKLGGFRGHFDTRDDERFRADRALDLSNPDTVPESFGSGLVISRTGLVLTCAHVVRNATKVYVRLPNGKGSWADIQALDSRSDLAVLRLLDPPDGMREVRFGDGGNLRRGQFVVGLANPYAAGYRDGVPSASWGIISNVRRRAPGVTSETDRALQSFHRYGTLIQTDVRLNPGCSGGALVNLDGEVVGVTTALGALTGLDSPGGFAVPVDRRMRQIIEVLSRGEEVEYGFLGVRMNPDDRARRGAVILDVLKGGPAERAGLQSNDVVVAINDNPVRNNDDLFLQIGSLTVGSEVFLSVRRGAEVIRKGPVSLTKLYVSIPSLASRRPPAPFGLRVDYMSVLSQRSFNALPDDGVVIREIVPKSIAEGQSLLQLDRVITRVNGKPVTSPSEFYRAMEQAGNRAEVTILNSEHRPETVILK